MSETNMKALYTGPEFLPSWVDPDKWFAIPEQARWNQSQAILLLLGHEGPAASMAAMRGFPSEPPKWLIVDRWEAASNTRFEEAVELEHRMAIEVAKAVKAERERTQAAKFCKHEYAKVPRNSKITTRACVLCGHVEDFISMRILTGKRGRPKVAAAFR